MADPFTSWFSAFNQTIGKFLYDPTTNWDLFNQSVVFNLNPQDAAVEGHVLSKVGSYGSQIDKLIDAIDVLQGQLLDRKALDAAQATKMAAFDALRDEAAKAVASFRESLSASDLLAGAKALHARNPDAAEALAAQIGEALTGKDSKSKAAKPVADAAKAALLSTDWPKG